MPWPRCWSPGATPAVALFPATAAQQPPPGVSVAAVMHFWLRASGRCAAGCGPGDRCLAARLVIFRPDGCDSWSWRRLHKLGHSTAASMQGMHRDESEGYRGKRIGAPEHKAQSDVRAARRILETCNVDLSTTFSGCSYRPTAVPLRTRRQLTLRAQSAKVRLTWLVMNLEPRMTFLDIGCSWGATMRRHRNTTLSCRGP